MDLSLGFMIKKGLSTLLMPISIAVILAVLALWYLHKMKYTKAKIFLTLSILWLTLISYAPFANILLEPLESQYSKITDIPEDVKHILLLGGGKEERAWEALRIYRAIEGAKIITSGYSFYDKVSDAQKTAILLQNSGVKAEDILMQALAKDTKEEAKAIQARLGDKAFFLVTSAYHMPRAMALFKKQGLHPIAAPTYFNNPNESSVATVWKSKQLRNTERAWHEYIGLLWGKIRGQI